MSVSDTGALSVKGADWTVVHMGASAGVLQLACRVVVPVNDDSAVGTLECVCHDGAALEEALEIGARVKA